MKGRRHPAFQSVLVPHDTGHGAIGYSSRERRRSLPWQELLLFVALIGLVAFAYVLLTAESSSAPTLSILAPAPDAAIPAGAVTVTVRAFHADRLLGSGGYHLHYYLDAEPPTAPGRPALTESASCFSTGETSHTWKLVGSGWHRLSAQLVRANDAPLSPAVVATVNVRVPASTSAAVWTPTGVGTPSASGVPATSPSRPSSDGGC
ncbi:MAG: hypothetical protein NTY63_02575 [Candidatus Bipolaricaulota bacterium]|nr:hypothetical protein [Candidatus Bipolaricaulota bacterium]